jgi:hypothetical protein
LMMIGEFSSTSLSERLRIRTATRMLVSAPSLEPMFRRLSAGGGPSSTVGVGWVDRCAIEEAGREFVATERGRVDDDAGAVEPVRETAPRLVAISR